MSEAGQSLPPLVSTEDTQDLVSAGLSGVERISRAAGQTLQERADVARLVEAPLVAAVKVLYDRNVPTNDSSANAEAGVYLSLVVDKLSPANRQLVDGFLVTDNESPVESHRFELYTDRGGNSNVAVRRVVMYGPAPTKGSQAIEEYFTGLANQFEEQSLEWAGLTVDEVEKARETGYDPIEDGYVIANDGRAYPSAELAKKQNAWLAKQPTENE